MHARVFRSSLLLAVIAALTIGTASAQTLIGSAGAGWQAWSGEQSNQSNLNNNGAPFWDVPFLTFNAAGYGGQMASKNVGWCLTSQGDCVGIASPTFAPGALPFWGMPYNPANDTGGALDTKVYFRGGSSSFSHPTYTATLYLNTATNNVEINEFGWFETDSTGSVNGARHVLFQGAGNPPGTNTPSPVGTVVNFQPTQYFGFYYQDVSDPQSFSPYQGCLAFSIFGFNDSDCTAASGQGDHVFAIFQQPGTGANGNIPAYWVAGQDPFGCTADGDCNLTLVRIRRRISN